MSTQKYQKLYTITLKNTQTDELETNHVFLHKMEYKRFAERINEIVYKDDNNVEWALQSIELKN